MKRASYDRLKQRHPELAKALHTVMAVPWSNKHDHARPLKQLDRVLSELDKAIKLAEGLEQNQGLLNRLKGARKEISEAKVDTPFV